jgi:Tol biopolymer transport system component
MGIEAMTFSIFRGDTDNQKDFLITTDQDDYLIYVNDHHLYFYNPVEDSHQPILPDWYIDTWYTFSISKEDRLAFSSAFDGGNNIYILDYPFKEDLPVRITSDNSAQYYRMTWSLDGKYLAYAAHYDAAATLFIWDGNTSFQVFHSPERIGEISWSPDGRLTFTEFNFVSSRDEVEDTSEIFIWDGEKTVNLSQNPSGQDRFPTWNADGQLAFLSEREGKHNIYIWDGVSEINGKPDMNTINNVAPNRTYYSSYPEGRR